MTAPELDDNRLTLDGDLKSEILLPLAERTGCDMKDLAFMCIALAVQEELSPVASQRRDPNNWHVNESETIYKFLSVLFKTDFPVRLASELANAGLTKIRSRVQSGAELVDIFKIGLSK